MKKIILTILKKTPFYVPLRDIYYKMHRDQKWENINQKNITITSQNDSQREIIKDILIRKNLNQEKQFDLHNYFISNQGRIIDKWLHYFDLYEKFFSKYRGKDINILEIGIQNGGSTLMWKEYFTKNSQGRVNIYGLDIDPRCKALEQKWEKNHEGGGGMIKIFVGSQEDRAFLRDLKTKIPKIDILIDDGGHTMKQQITTFEELFDHISEDGLYWCEDCHTSYLKGYNAGYKKKYTYIEYCKNLIDDLNSRWSDSMEDKTFYHNALGISFYDSIVVIEKQKREQRYDTIASRAIIGNDRIIY